MKVIGNRRQEIIDILIEARPYFKKEGEIFGSYITLNSSEEELKEAKRRIGKTLHPDILAQRTDLSNEERDKLTLLLAKANSALDDLIQDCRERQEANNKEPQITARLNYFVEKYKKATTSGDTLINYYELFELDSQLSSSQIMQSSQYLELAKLLVPENIKYSSESSTLYCDLLIGTFSHFQTTILGSEYGRKVYDGMLKEEAQKQQSQNPNPNPNPNPQPRPNPNPNPQPQKETSHVTTYINELLACYKEMITNGFVDYYRLFGIDMKINSAQLVKTPKVAKLNSMLVPTKFKEYDLDPTLEKQFISLCQTYNSFIKDTLRTEDRKQQYDRALIEFYRQNPHKKPTIQPQPRPVKDRISKEADKYRYIFTKQKTNTKEVLSLKVKALYKAIEKGIELYGVSKTVFMLNTLFKTRLIKSLSPEMIALLQPYTSKDEILSIIQELNNKFIASNTLELAEKNVSHLISRKTDVLVAALSHTAKKHSIPQAVTALHEYVINDNANHFSRGDEKTIGRERVLMEIDHEFIKFILASMDEGKILLLDFPKHLQDEFNDIETINTLVRENIKTRKIGFRK